MTTADFASGSHNLLQTLNSNCKLEEHGKWEVWDYLGTYNQGSNFTWLGWGCSQGRVSLEVTHKLRPEKQMLTRQKQVDAEERRVEAL